MKAPSTSIRMIPLPGISVRDTAQAIGTAKIRHKAVTQKPSRTEFHIASR